MLFKHEKIANDKDPGQTALEAFASTEKCQSVHFRQVCRQTLFKS